MKKFFSVPFKREYTQCNSCGFWWDINYVLEGKDEITYGRLDSKKTHCPMCGNKLGDPKTLKHAMEETKVL